jgi:hypothetical protein
MQLNPNEIHEVDPPSLELVLDQMLLAAPGSVVMVVCHGAEQGGSTEGGMLLHFPGELAPSLVTSAIKIFKQVDDAETQAQQIRQMPAKTAEEKKQKSARWQQLLNGPSVGDHWTGEFPLAEMEKAYNNFLHRALNSGDRRKGLNVGSLAVFQRINDKVKRVRALKLERLELRACAIGNDPTAMQAVKEFFGCTKFLAPKVHTFYGGVRGIESLNQALRTVAPRELQRDVLTVARVPGPAPAPGRRGARPRVHTHVTRIDWNLLMQRAAQHHTRLFLFLEPLPQNAPLPDPSLVVAGRLVGAAVLVLIDPIPNTIQFRTELAIFTNNEDGVLDEGRVSRFLDACIMPGARWGQGQAIPLAALTTDGAPSTFEVFLPDGTHGQAALGPFVLPNEPKYKELIVQV